MPNHVALYPGSFDPPTLGHLDLIQRASNIFHKVIVAVAHNDAKSSMFTMEERIEMLEELVQGMSNVEVGHFVGLTVDYAQKCKAISIIRGLRVMSDFEYELSLAMNNRKLNPDVDTVCLMSSEPYLFLSSRQVKEIARFGGRISHYVTPEVERRIFAKFGVTKP
jgi:pantetheine-phosphate adenylyltransferase